LTQLPEGIPPRIDINCEKWANKEAIYYMLVWEPTWFHVAIYQDGSRGFKPDNVPSSLSFSVDGQSVMSLPGGPEFPQYPEPPFKADLSREQVLRLRSTQQSLVEVALANSKTPDRVFPAHGTTEVLLL
jgi:hypothetical protein